MSEFQYKEDDHIGESTLDAISGADQFNRWMYRVISKHTKGEILEIGSGIGNISGHYLEDGKTITLTDIRKSYCDKLQKKFNSYPNLKGVYLIDLVDANFAVKYADHLNRYDSIFALNVVEHIKDDHLAIQNARKMLKPGGNLVILVPAYQSLYNSFDLALEHYRRYTRLGLARLFKANEFEIVHEQYFNFIGILGWYVSGKLMKNESIPEGQMGLYNALVPVFKVIDRLIMNKIGLSVICVGKKK